VARDEVLPAREHAHSVAESLAEAHWADTIPDDRPTFLFADGLLAFLAEPVIIGWFRSITQRFGTGEVDLFPGWIRTSTKISARIPAMARKARILRYRF
jgi:O-methyltransferase involved in polyketide biosynthesis